MPWKNDGPGGNRGPWGQGPSGGNNGNRNNNDNNNNNNQGGGPNAPDLDEIIRRAQAGMKRFFGGGPPVRPGSGPGPAAPSGPHVAGWLLTGAALVAGFVTFMSFNQIQADQQGVVLRLGVYNRTVQPGLHFALWPVESLERVAYAAQRKTEVGGDKDGLMLTGDQNIVRVKFTIFWRVSDAPQYLFNLQKPEETLRAVGESVMREVIGRTPAQEFRTRGRGVASLQVTDILQRSMDSYKSGIIITSIELNEAAPPPEVREAFADVQRAELDQAKLRNEADQYANQILRRVEGDAAKATEDAEGYRAQTVAEAKGQAQRFESIYAEYAKAKDVTRTRIFLETIESVLSKGSVVVVEKTPGGQSIVPWMQVPQPLLNDKASSGVKK